MEERPLPAPEASRRLARARLADETFRRGRVLGSMYTTPHPAGVAAFRSFLEANLGNAGLYPGTAGLEGELLEWLGALTGMPGTGLVTSGGSEANLLALWAAREGRPGRRRVLYGANAHFSLAKAVQVLGLKGEVLPLGCDQRLDLEALERALQGPEPPLAVVVQAGSTELGLCDELERVGELLEGLPVHLHVDAAFGGFVLPFLEGPASWRGLGRGADTLTIDPHKMGRAPIPAGCLLVREPKLLERISQQAPYLTRQRQVGLLGTRCSAGVAGAWAAVAATGRSGYQVQARACLSRSLHLVQRLRELDLEVVAQPQTNLVAFQVSDATRMKQRLVERGWYPSRLARQEALRIVVMPHVTLRVLEAFLLDLAALREK